MDERYRDLGMTREHTEEIVHAALPGVPAKAVAG